MTSEEEKVKPVIHLGIEPASYPDGAVERVSQIAQGYDVLATTDRSDVEKHLDGIEIVFSGFIPDLIEKLPRLRWIQQAGAGADWLDSYPSLRSAKGRR